MQNQAQILQKADRYIRRYNRWSILTGFAVVILWAIGFSGNLLTIILSLIGGLLIFAVSSHVIMNRCVHSILIKELDAQTYLEVLSRPPFKRSSATWRLWAEFWCGNYHNAVNLCQEKLANPKAARGHWNEYHVLLANVYFDMGEMENCRLVLEEYQRFLAQEPPKKQERLRAMTPRMVFYDLYLKQDWEACAQWVNQPIAGALNQYGRLWLRAKMALAQGNTEEARGYCQTLAGEIPQLNYGKLAAMTLGKLDHPETPQAPFGVAQAGGELPPSSSAQKPKSAFLIALIILAILVFVIAVFNLFSPKGYDTPQELFREPLNLNYTDLNYDRMHRQWIPLDEVAILPMDDYMVMYICYVRDSKVPEDVRVVFKPMKVVDGRYCHLTDSTHLYADDFETRVHGGYFSSSYYSLEYDLIPTGSPTLSNYDPSVYQFRRAQYTDSLGVERDMTFCYTYQINWKPGDGSRPDRF